MKVQIGDISVHKAVYITALNTERVRSYMEKNLGCSRKEAARDLGLCISTINRHWAIIRRQCRQWNANAKS